MMAELEQREIDLLLEEFKASWEMIFRVDERRHKIVQIQIASHAVVFSILAAMFTKGSSINFALVFVCLVAVALAIGNAVAEKILDSERKANLRARRRLNQIRDMLMPKSNSGLVENYRNNYFDIGIVFSHHPQPSGEGRTLVLVKKFLYLLQLSNVGLVLFAVTMLVWRKG